MTASAGGGGAYASTEITARWGSAAIPDFPVMGKVRDVFLPQAQCHLLRIIHNGYVFHVSGRPPASVAGGREAANHYE
jgi:hypothetical protein